MSGWIVDVDIKDSKAEYDESGPSLFIGSASRYVVVFCFLEVCGFLMSDWVMEWLVGLLSNLIFFLDPYKYMKCALVAVCSFMHFVLCFREFFFNHLH